MIGGVSVKEIGRELDRVADRAADELAEAPAGRAATGIEAGQLDPRVTAHAQRLQLPGELAVGEGVLADDDFSARSRAAVTSCAAVGLADPDDSPLGPQLDHIAEKVRPMAAAGRQQRRVGKRDRSHLQVR